MPSAPLTASISPDALIPMSSVLRRQRRGRVLPHKRVAGCDNQAFFQSLSHGHSIKWVAVKRG